MNEKDTENDKIERLLRIAHPSEPSPLLKERIITEAKKVWNQTSAQISWQIPVWRLAGSAAAAVLVISIANLYSDHILKRWHYKDTGITQQQAPDIETLPQIFNPTYIRYLVSFNRKSFIADDSTLRDYAESLQQVLNEMQQTGASNGRLPDGETSLLFPVYLDFDYYS